MATIYKRGKTWWISYTDETGKRKWKSTGQTYKAAAQELKKKYDAIEKERKINGFEFKQSIKFSALKDDYLKIREKKRAEETLRIDRLVLNRFQEFLKEDKDLNEIKNPDIDRWYSKQLKKYSPATANIYLRHLKTFFNSAVKKEYLNRSPVKNIEKAREAVKKIRVLTRNEADRIIKTTAGSAWEKLIKTALYTGARAGELCRLSPDDIDMEKQVMTILSVQDNQTKSGKFRTVPLPASSIDFFGLLKESAEPPHLLRNDSGNHWITDWISKGFKKQARKAEIEDVTFHDLRRTYGAWLIMAGADIVTVSENLGHSDINITRKHYIHLMMDYRKSQVDKLPKI